jgi:erythronate-4-phosphate dehydrogenase
MKIIADDKIPFLKGVMEPYADIIYLPGAGITAADVHDADAIFTRTRTKCDASLLDGSRVKLIATATIGFDHIDTDYCDAAGIRWVNAPGCNSGSVKQYVTAAIVTWVKEKSLKLHDLTVGVVGVGNVGGKVAAAAEALGMRVLLNDPPRAVKEPGFVALDALLAESDIVTCHTPLTMDGVYGTYHLASDDFFGKMKPGALFINTSRGAVADTAALKRALRNPYILDVWEGEPTPDGGLLRNAFIGTPHIAGYSADGKAGGTAACIREFCSYFSLDILPGWYPPHIPEPPMPLVFAIDGMNKSREQLFFEAVTHTYPVWEDSNRLKNSPDTFEQQRGGYRIRREFENFTILPRSVGDDALHALRTVGFRIG